MFKSQQPTSNNDKQVTIGICIKNNAATIRASLESVVCLNYPTELLEVIIVDGVSTDDTLSIANGILSKFKLNWSILSDGGLGIGYARQVLVSQCQTEFVAFVDADQSLDPNWLKASVSCLASHPEVVGVRGGQGLTRNLPLPSALENIIKFLEDNESPPQIRVDTFALGGSLFRRKPILDAGGFDSTLRLCAEDTDLAARLLQKRWMIINLKSAIFYHSPRTSWRSLFSQYFNWGRNLASVRNKSGDSLGGLSNSKVLAESISLILLSLKKTPKAFACSRDVRCAFLPMHYMYKRAAFAMGFLLAH